MDTTTRLRLLLANVVADAGSMRDVVTTEVRESNDVAYLLQEWTAQQNAAHRIVAFLDEGVIGDSRH